MTARQISDGNPDGWLLGQAAADKGAFFGGTPVVQQTTPTAVTTAASTTTASYGYATTTQANGIVTAIAAIKLAIDNLALTA